MLFACVAGHTGGLADEKFLRCLPLLEKGTVDERNLMEKGVSRALRMDGLQSPGLRKACTALAKRRPGPTVSRPAGRARKRCVSSRSAPETGFCHKKVREAPINMSPIR